MAHGSKASQLGRDGMLGHDRNDPARWRARLDHPIDVVIDLGLEIVGPAFIDRGMQRA